MDGLAVNINSNAPRRIAFIQPANHPSVRSGPTIELEWFEQNLGDHGEIWVLKIVDGVEVAAQLGGESTP